MMVFHVLFPNKVLVVVYHHGGVEEIKNTTFCVWFASVQVTRGTTFDLIVRRSDRKIG